jgi:hypothetical protein
MALIRERWRTAQFTGSAELRPRNDTLGRAFYTSASGLRRCSAEPTHLGSLRTASFLLLRDHTEDFVPQLLF